MKKPKSISASDSATSVQVRATIDEARRPRSDGIEARHRLLDTALRLFAEKGFQKTSTREIAQLAEVNVASIKYYFGDKAGLYKAAFIEPMMGSCQRCVLEEQPDLPLDEGLHAFFVEYLAPLQQSDIVQLCLRLHFREMVEPTGLWQDEIDAYVKPSHAALIQLLQRHLQIKKADDDLHRLAFSIASLGMQVYVSRDIIHAIRPSLIHSASALDLWAAQLADYAYAMASSHAQQRGVALPVPDDKVFKKKKKT